MPTHTQAVIPKPDLMPTIVSDGRLSEEALSAEHLLWLGDTEEMLTAARKAGRSFRLIVTSPPYNLGKSYEEKRELEAYVKWQARIIRKCRAVLRPGGSICWQVGNYVCNGGILPLDILLHPIFQELGLTLRNRIVWTFGHGLHCQTRFSGRYEVVLWYTDGDDYVFDLDAVRIPSKYPGKKAFKGPRAGAYSSNPLGKNPSDVWEIPNVKANHVEKTSHPCQFPIGRVQRFVQKRRVYTVTKGITEATQTNQAFSA